MEKEIKNEDGYKKLYRMLYDRLVNFHGLNNLIWVFNANEVKEGVDPYEEYYPGDDIVDILTTDVTAKDLMKLIANNFLRWQRINRLHWAKSEQFLL